MYEPGVNCLIRGTESKDAAVVDIHDKAGVDPALPTRMEMESDVKPLNRSCIILTSKKEQSHLSSSVRNPSDWNRCASRS